MGGVGMVCMQGPESAQRLRSCAWPSSCVRTLMLLCPYGMHAGAGARGAAEGVGCTRPGG